MEKSLNPESEILLLQEVIYGFIKQKELNSFKEFELMRFLQTEPNAFFSAQALQDPLALFQTHFMVFHCLYALRPRFWTQGLALEIHTLEIKLTPQTQPSAIEDNINQSLQGEDKLAQYYLDWRNFDKTDKTKVEQLLNDFWRRMAAPQLSDDHQALSQALELLELEASLLNDLVSHWPTIKKQYRRLAMQHHPDRLTDKVDKELVAEKFKQISHAFYLLKQAQQASC